MEKKELQPIYASVNSFYKKAWILEEDDVMILQSYQSMVAEYDKNEKALYFKGYTSQTTLRHIKEFILQLGFKPISKKEQLMLWENDKSLKLKGE